MLFRHHDDAIEVSLAQVTNDWTTDFDVILETTWTCIRLGAILHRALYIFEKSCTGVMSLKMV